MEEPPPAPFRRAFPGGVEEGIRRVARFGSQRHLLWV